VRIASIAMMPAAARTPSKVPEEQVDAAADTDKPQFFVDCLEHVKPPFLCTR